jgi:serine/threonine protein kinase/Tol biopolymer transport system component
MALTPGSRLGPYEIVSAVGAGGMGEIFKARDTRLGRSVAIKVLPEAMAKDERFLTRFEREAKAISQLSHPNICTLHDIGRENGTSYLVMELLEGETLADRLSRGPMPVKDVVRYGAEVADALDRAHKAGIIHRDLKPGNVMITKSGAKLLDFGLARPAPGVMIDPDASTQAQSITQEGMIVGTMPYMAPEQLRGGELDARTDIYALGVMLHEMATGRRLFTASDSASLIAKILEQTPPRLRDVQAVAPPPLDHIVATCLEKEPDDRFQCAADVGHELRWLMRGEDTATDVQPARSRKLVASSIAAAVVLAAVAMYAAYRLGSRNTPSSSAAKFSQLTFDRGDEIHPAISPDGKMVAFVKTVNGHRDIFLQRVDGRSAIDLTAGSGVDNDEPAFSPDGNTIAFRSERDGGGIFVMGATGESVRRVTSKGYNPAWSPEGKELVFAEQRTIDPHAVYGLPNLDIADVASGATRILYAATDVMQPSWSPHGQRIAFWSAMKGHRAVFTIDRTGQPSSVVAATSGTALVWNPVWSPDGAWLYFVSDRDGTMNLWRIAIDEKSGHTKGAPQSMRLPSTDAGFVSVARDTGRVVYQSAAQYGELIRVTVDAANQRATVDPQPLVSGSMGVRYMKTSPDGRWIAFASGTQEDVYVMKGDGTDIRQLTDDPALDRGISWWPDSSRIIFYSNRAGDFDAWTIRPDGSDLTRLTAIAGGINFPRVSPDGKSLAFISDRGAGAAIATLNGPLPVTKEVPLPSEIARRFVPTSWSPNGRLIVGGTYGARGLSVYSLDTGQFVTAVPDGLTAAFLNDYTVGFVDGARRIGMWNLATHETRYIGELPVDPSYRPGTLGALSIDARGVLFSRIRGETDIWQMQLTESRP